MHKPRWFEHLVSNSYHKQALRSRSVADLFVWFDYLRPSQQFFSYVGTGLPGLHQYSQ